MFVCVYVWVGALVNEHILLLILITVTLHKVFILMMREIKKSKIN